MQKRTFSTTNQPRLAVLIGAENLSGAHATRLTLLVKELGKPIVRRAWGDMSDCAAYMYLEAPTQSVESTA